MAKDQKKMVDSITSMDEDFAKWYGKWKISLESFSFTIPCTKTPSGNTASHGSLPGSAPCGSIRNTPSFGAANGIKQQNREKKLYRQQIPDFISGSCCAYNKHYS